MPRIDWGPVLNEKQVSMTAPSEQMTCCFLANILCMFSLSKSCSHCPVINKHWHTANQRVPQPVRCLFCLYIPSPVFSWCVCWQKAVNSEEFGPTMADLEKQIAAHNILHKEIESYSPQLCVSSAGSKVSGNTLTWCSTLYSCSSWSKPLTSSWILIKTIFYLLSCLLGELYSHEETVQQSTGELCSRNNTSLSLIMKSLEFTGKHSGLVLSLTYNKIQQNQYPLFDLYWVIIIWYNPDSQ